MGKIYSNGMRTLVASLFFIFLIGFASSAPPVTQVQQFIEGYVIEVPQISEIQTGQDYFFKFYVFNISTHMPVTSGLSFNFYISDKTGGYIYTAYNNAPSEQNGYYFNVSGGNFSKAGTYSFHTQCNDSYLGGSVPGTLIVTPTGNALIAEQSNIAFFVLIILLLYTITFAGFFSKNIPITILGGMALMFLGVYMINNGVIIYRDDLTNYFSYITIGIGFICSMWASYDWYKDM